MYYKRFFGISQSDDLLRGTANTTIRKRGALPDARALSFSASAMELGVVYSAVTELTTDDARKSRWGLESGPIEECSTNSVIGLLWK